MKTVTLVLQFRWKPNDPPRTFMYRDWTDHNQLITNPEAAREMVAEFKGESDDMEYRLVERTLEDKVVIEPESL